MKKVQVLMALGLVLVLIIFFFPYHIIAGELEELNWKARALQAESVNIQNSLKASQEAIQAFLQELKDKGYMIKDGRVEKLPPPPPEKKGNSK